MKSRFHLLGTEQKVGLVWHSFLKDYSAFICIWLNASSMTASLQISEVQLSRLWSRFQLFYKYNLKHSSLVTCQFKLQLFRLSIVPKDFPKWMKFDAKREIILQIQMLFIFFLLRRAEAEAKYHKLWLTSAGIIYGPQPLYALSQEGAVWLYEFLHIFQLIYRSGVELKDVINICGIL